MPSASTSFVLARPGTPTTGRDRPPGCVTSAFSTTCSWPKTTRGDGLARLADLFDRGFGGMHDGGIETGGVRELSAHGVTPSCFPGLSASQRSGLCPAPYPSTKPWSRCTIRRMHHSCQCPHGLVSASSPAVLLIRGLLHTISWGASSQSAAPPEVSPSQRAKVIQLARTSLTVFAAWGETVANGLLAARTQSALGRRRMVNSIRPSSSSRHHSISRHVGSFRKAVEPLPGLLARFLRAAS